MRPDAIDWNSRVDHASLAFLPRRRLPKVISRWTIVVIAVQALLSGALMLGLAQGWWPTMNKQAVPMIALLAAMALVPALAMVLLRWSVRHWSEGLYQLHAAIKRLASGAQPKPVTVGSEGEVAYLAVAFNDMAGKLLAGRCALVKANEDLEQRVAMRTSELSVANAELDRKNVMLAQVTDTALRFTDDVAHEFRTPLTVIHEYSSIMTDGLSGPVSDQQAEFLRYITNATEELASLVDDFLDSSKLRAGGLRVNRRAYSVNEIIESTWPMIETRAAENQIALDRCIDDDLPSVFIDIDKAKRTLVNLAVNAVKFTKSGGRVAISAHHGAHGGVEIAITDQGPGLSPEALAGLFKRFKQGGDGERSSFKGFGLGLNIVRDLVAINLGSVSIRSVVGKGSTFSFSLPSDDPKVIVGWMLDRTMERNPSAMVTALRITRDGPTTNLDELQAYLASVIYARDVQVRAGDDPALLVIGETGEPLRWIKRLELHDEDRRTRDSRQSLAPLNIEMLGVWPVSDDKELLVSSIFTDHSVELLSHA